MSGVTVTCDLALTNTHGGRHSGLVATYTLFDRVLASTRVYWETTAARAVFQKPAVLGESDLVGLANQAAGNYTVGVTPAPVVAPPVAYDVTTPFTTSGSFTIPAEADYLDIVLLAGGSGGDGGAGAAQGKGGPAGGWSLTTLTRGVNFPSSAIAIVIGGGGAGSGAGGSSGATGGSTTASGTGMSTLTAAGVPNPHTFGGSLTGLSPGTQYFNGANYAGGGQQSSSNSTGNAPGGGGSGGSISFFLTSGGNGARGQAWIRAYN